MKQNTRLGRFCQREVTPYLARLLQKVVRVKQGRILSLGSGGVSPVQYRLLKRELKQYDGLKMYRYNNYFGQSIVTRLIRMPYLMATSEVILVEDVCRLIKYLDRNDDQIIIQTWHALGAFKKFGLANVDNLVRLDNEEKDELQIIHVYDYVLDPGYRFREKYKESFAQGEILEGIFNPRVDLLFDEDYMMKKKARLYENYPQLENKKVLLYTPTYRGFSSRVDADHFMDFDQVLDHFDDNYVLVLKKHPSMKKSSYQPPSERNAHKFLDISNVHVNNLMLIADMLINDYSSTFFEFALLGKPVVFFAKDLDDYLDSRGFYFDYKEFVPGSICRTELELQREISKRLGDNSQVKRFVTEYFGDVPSNNSERLANFIVDFVNRSGSEIVQRKEEEVIEYKYKEEQAV
ncbi:CDP-glycerol glycerophosphotransferase family protein [Mechercharimyces sp. CAU 1602]|nr:CDP-glycerol glycerophosphotransferase family protein [Mechercharimyces sp. CAU 1602]